MRIVVTALAAMAVGAPAPAAHAGVDAGAGPAVLDYRIIGDGVPAPLNGRRGDPQRGRTIVVDRRQGNCLICHTLPVDDEPFQGDIGPPLAGVGQRLSEAQLRLRLIDASRLNAETLMPPYYRVGGLVDVAPEFRGQPALNARQIEDVIAYLVTLTRP